ncbi:SDR family NAD(P)-dependent oxidoreductase [Paraburkholderia sp. CNPSo 3272]|uniref:SDR family NAD(P)-dependent oxidoreductase n=1 Tax=Paraburkholderia sp. CNPSo 3272 TaxID=2940931 RepID=UPI0035CD0BA5
MAKRIAYVTGGMGGIGTAICQRLYTDGLTVVAGCGPKSQRRERWLAEQAERGFSFIASEGNVADWESTEAAFVRVKKEVGDIDASIHNCGIRGSKCRVRATTRRPCSSPEPGIRALFGTHATIDTTRAASQAQAAPTIEAGGRRIIAARFPPAARTRPAAQRPP